jgi:hypothetical protein
MRLAHGRRSNLGLRRIMRPVHDEPVAGDFAMLLEICLLALLAPPEAEVVAEYVARSAEVRKVEIAEARQTLREVRYQIRIGAIYDFRTVELSEAYSKPLREAEAKAEAKLERLEDEFRPWYAAIDFAQPGDQLGRIADELTIVEVVDRQHVIVSHVVAVRDKRAKGDKGDKGDLLERQELLALPLRTFGRKRSATFFADETVWHYVRTERTKRGDVRHFEAVPVNLLQAKRSGKP